MGGSLRMAENPPLLGGRGAQPGSCWHTAYFFKVHRGWPHFQASRPHQVSYPCDAGKSMTWRVVQGELLPEEASEHARAGASDVPLASTPLAARMRPRTLDEYVGQEHLIGPGRAL